MDPVTAAKYLTASLLAFERTNLLFRKRKITLRASVVLNDPGHQFFFLDRPDQPIVTFLNSSSVWGFLESQQCNR
jgi:hypothetical protein